MRQELVLDQFEQSATSTLVEPEGFQLFPTATPDLPPAAAETPVEPVAPKRPKAASISQAELDAMKAKVQCIGCALCRGST